MPGTLIVDPATFTAVMLMSCGPKREFGSDTKQATSSSGVPKWECQAAVTYAAEPGMRQVSEVISVGITGHQDPGAGINPGTPVAFEGLRAGLNPPEKNDRGGIKGGRMWFTATGLRSFSAQRAKSDAA
jgi:hypothetical protein